MNQLDNYLDKDVVKHFAALINESVNSPIKLLLCGQDLWSIIDTYGLNKLLPPTLSLISGDDIGITQTNKQVIDKTIDYSNDNKTIITIKESYLNMPGTTSTLYEQHNAGADIRIVNDILGAMVVASKKRRNRVVFPITGFEDEALITAAGLAKSKTVGFRNFFVLNGHNSLVGVTNFLAKQEENLAGCILPLKVGLNTGVGQYSNIPLIYHKGVVFSGYEPMEIMQSVWMVISQQLDKSPAVAFQRTKEVSDEVINRSRWMLEEVFEPAPLSNNKYGAIANGRLHIKEKYKDFDAEFVLK